MDAVKPGAGSDKSIGEAVSDDTESVIAPAMITDSPAMIHHGATTITIASAMTANVIARFDLPKRRGTIQSTVEAARVPPLSRPGTCKPSGLSDPLDPVPPPFTGHLVSSCFSKTLSVLICSAAFIICVRASAQSCVMPSDWHFHLPRSAKNESNGAIICVKMMVIRTGSPARNPWVRTTDLSPSVPHFTRMRDNFDENDQPQIGWNGEFWLQPKRSQKQRNVHSKVVPRRTHSHHAYACTLPRPEAPGNKQYHFKIKTCSKPLVEGQRVKSLRIHVCKDFSKK